MFSNARLARFTSQGDVLRVTGTPGHVLKTDAFIKRRYKVRLQVEEEEEKETNDFLEGVAGIVEAIKTG